MQAKDAPYNPRVTLAPGDPEYDNLKAAMTEFGYIAKVVWNEATGHIVGGHQRVHVLRDMGYTELEVTVINEPDIAREQVINVQLNQIRGRWDNELLQDLVGSLPTEMTEYLGFDSSELDSILNGAVETLAPAVIPDDTFDLGEAMEQHPDTTITKPGEVWQLGNHRLLIGDSTNLEAMTGFVQEHVSLAFCDPPYNLGLNYTAETDDTKSEAEYQAFSKAWLTAARVLSDRIIVTPGWHNLPFWLHAIPPKFVAVWTKLNATTHGIISRFNCWEPILFYGENFGRLRHSDIFDFPISSQKMVGSHACPKPLNMLVEILNCYTDPGNVVVDLFLGAGTTLIAAEHTERRCYGVDIAPLYADITIARWEALTGSQAIRVDI